MSLFAFSLHIKQFYLTLSGDNTPGQSEPEDYGSEGELHIPQTSRVGASPSDYLVSYTGHSSSVVLLRLMRLNGFKYCYVTPTIKFSISHLFEHS